MYYLVTVSTIYARVGVCLIDGSDIHAREFSELFLTSR